MAETESRTEPMLLVDCEDHCEDRGWVEATVSEAEAWEVLRKSEGWTDAEIDAPSDPPKRVWLALGAALDPADLIHDWVPAEPKSEGAREFWEFHVS